MTDHIESTETTTPSRLRLEGDDELLKALALVTALDKLINARPPYNS